MLSYHTETFTVFDSLGQFFEHLSFCFIVWKKQLIEASVSNRELFFVIAFDSDNKLNFFKSSNWNSSRSGGEGEKFFSLLFIKLVKDDIPEPLNKLMIGMERLNVFCHSLQLFKVKVFGTTDKLFKLLGVVQVNQHIFIENFVKASFE